MVPGGVRWCLNALGGPGGGRRGRGEGREALESAPEPGTDVALSLHAAALRFDNPKDKEKKPTDGGGDADGRGRGPGRYQQMHKMFDNHLTTTI